MKKQKDKMKALRDFNMVELINRSGGKGVHANKRTRGQEKLNFKDKINRGNLDDI